MRTSARKFLLSKEHEQRFNQLEVLNKNFENDINYTSCGFLLSANEEIFRKVLPYISTGGIDWNGIRKKVDLTSGQLPIIQYAFDLFTSGGRYGKDIISLTDLAYCDREIVDAVLIAINLFLDRETRGF